MRARRPFGGLALALSVILLVASAGVIALIQRSADHAAIGKWRGEIGSLILYPDNKATLNSVLCSWNSDDTNEAPIRITPQVAISIPQSPVKIAAGIELDFRLGAGGNQAILEILGIPVQMTREGGQDMTTDFDPAGVAAPALLPNSDPLILPPPPPP